MLMLSAEVAQRRFEDLSDLVEEGQTTLIQRGDLTFQLRPPSNTRGTRAQLNIPAATEAPGEPKD